MGMTLAEKLLSKHIIEGKASAGEIVDAEVDLLMVHEVLGSRIMPILEEMGVEKVWNPESILVVNDHWAPAPDIASAKIHAKNRQFVRTHGITHFCDVNCGISHQVLPEMGLVAPGDLVIGSDSHSTTYGAFNAFSTGLAATDSALIIATGKCWFKVPESIQIEVTGELGPRVMSKDLILSLLSDLGPDGANYMSMEFIGETIEYMSVGSRMTMCNMSVEAGAKCAPMEINDDVRKWMETYAPERKWSPLEPDDDAEYFRTVNVDLNESPLEPIVATPHSPANGQVVSEVEGTPIDQAFIGSCTNGRLEDLAIGAEILKDRQVADGTRLIITPASTKTLQRSIEEGIVQTLLKAGAIVTNSTCGACVGGHLGVLGPGEVCISSTNRNFRGRMGHRDSEIYLASPATVAASAIRGAITDPRSV